MKNSSCIRTLLGPVRPTGQTGRSYQTGYRKTPTGQTAYGHRLDWGHRSDRSANFGRQYNNILMLLSSWGIELESLMATPQSAWSIGDACYVCIVEIDLVRFLDYKVTGMHMTIDDPYIK